MQKKDRVERVDKPLIIKKMEGFSIARQGIFEELPDSIKRYWDEEANRWMRAAEHRRKFLYSYSEPGHLIRMLAISMWAMNEQIVELNEGIEAFLAAEGEHED